MRGWIVGLSIFGWLVMTAVCSVGAFVSARQLQLSTVDSGLQLPELNVRNVRPTATVASTTIAELATPALESTAAPTQSVDTTDVVAQSTPTNAVEAEPTAQTENALVRGALQRTGPRKVNILLLGIDQRSAVESAETEFFRTDTMIVLQLDPVRRTAAMLSIPRDLYVPIPTATEARINTANVLGDTGGYPGGGPALAMKTVEENLGLELDHYVLVNFDVFLTVVDTVAANGVEVCIPESIYDPFFPDEGYGFIEVRFDAGCQRLDSTQLLQYARTRKTQGSDFDRARRQQQVILAVQREVVSAGGIVNLAANAPSLWQQLGANLRTDLTFEEALDLALIATTIDTESVQTGTINNLHTTFAKAEDGSDILIPVPASISALIQDTFNSGGATMTAEDLRARADEESASVIVLNNTTVTGLAGSTRDWLNARGVAVTTVGNTQNPDNSDTVIRDYTGNPWTARLIADTLGIPRERILPGTDGQTSEDIAVLIGSDIQGIIGQ